MAKGKTNKRTKKAKTATPRRAGRREGGTVIQAPGLGGGGRTAVTAGGRFGAQGPTGAAAGLTGAGGAGTAGGAVTFGGAARPAPRAPGGLTPRRGGAGGAGGGITFPGGFPG
mgnify:CR=1 FL=1